MVYLYLDFINSLYQGGVRDNAKLDLSRRACMN
jgi:hypothetical protein